MEINRPVYLEYSSENSLVVRFPEISVDCWFGFARLEFGMATQRPYFQLVNLLPSRGPRLRIGTLFVMRSMALALALLVPAAGLSQDTPDFFREKCKSCHTIGGGRLAGPDLKNVTDRKDRNWLTGFMMNPQSYIDSGDSYAAKLLEDYRSVMPSISGMTTERCEKLLDLIEAESKLEESQFKGVQISNKPFTEADRVLGRDIFLGKKRLQNGGAACISCHSMHDTPLLGGGALAPDRQVSDLTNVFERLKGRKVLSNWLAAPATETMQPIFKNRAMNSDEIHSLVAYFEASAGDSPAQPASSRVAFLLMGLLGAAGVIFGFDAIWKRRFHSVRQPLVDATSLQATGSLNK